MLCLLATPCDPPLCFYTTILEALRSIRSIHSIHAFRMTLFLFKLQVIDEKQLPLAYIPCSFALRPYCSVYIICKVSRIDCTVCTEYRRKRKEHPCSWSASWGGDFRMVGSRCSQQSSHSVADQETSSPFWLAAISEARRSVSCPRSAPSSHSTTTHATCLVVLYNREL